MTSFYRVTERSIAANVLTGLQGNISKLGETQVRLSSGKNFQRPSESPTGTVESMQFRSDIAASKQYSRNADDGVGWLGVTDTALTSIIEQVRRARDLVLQGMSAGSATAPGARDAIAAEVGNIRSAAIGLANTTYLDRPVFGGTTTGRQAFDSTGGYVGDAGTVLRTVGDGQQVRVDTDGSTVFGSGAGQVFTVLADVADHMANDPNSLGADLDRIDVVLETLTAGLASVGARTNQLEYARQVADDRVLDLTSQLSDVEDIDLPKTLTDLQLQQTAYQAALAAGARVVQPSLVDFLR